MIREKISRFITFYISRRLIALMSVLLKPFSKVSNKEIMANSEFEWSKLLENNWEAIRNEVNILLENDKYLPTIEQIQPREEKLNRDNKWKTFFLYGFGIRSDKNCQKCPVTANVLQQIPGMLTGFFSILYPGKHIPAHRGIFKGIVRTHLGLIVPSANNGECKMKVGKETIIWQAGKAIFFDDTYLHEVWNNSKEIRVVLLIDTVRPYKKIAAKINNAIIRRITNSVYVKDALKKNEDWEKTYSSVFA